MKRRLVYCILLLGVLSCRQQQQQPDPGLRVVHQSAVRSLDPQTTDDFVTLSALSNVYEALVQRNSSMKLEPALATSWTNPDDNTWRFELRRNVSFHDGHPFTAEDVKHTLDRGLTHPESFIKAELPDVRETRVIGPGIVEITTSRPDPLLLAKMTRVFILSRNSGDHVAERCNGTGPYRMVSFDGNSGLHLQSFGKYWRGSPKWNRADIVWNEDANARLREVDQGRADFAETPPDLHRSAGAGRIVKQSSVGLTLLGFRVIPEPENPFADANVRKAIRLLLDQSKLRDTAMPGKTTRVFQLAPMEVFGFIQEMPVPSPDPDFSSAREAMRASHFPDGFKSPMYFSSSFKTEAKSIAEQVKTLGIDLELNESNAATMDQMLFDQKAPVYIMNYTFPTLDSSDLLYFTLHTRTADRRYGLLNFSGYSNPELDRILEESSTEMHAGKRLQLLTRAMKISMDSNVWIPLGARIKTFALSSRVQWTGNSLGRISLEEISPAPPHP